MPENEILAGAARVLPVNLNEKLPHRTVNTVPVDNLPQAVFEQEVILQFPFPREQLRIGVAVLDEGCLALAICTGERYKALAVVVKVDTDFVLVDSLLYPYGSPKPNRYQFPLAFGLSRSLRDFRVQGLNLFRVAFRELDSGVPGPDFKLFRRGAYRRDFRSADGFDRDVAKSYTRTFDRA
ncbi:hypothetical protein Holit_03230 [Hollandina sp. SP2]